MANCDLSDEKITLKIDDLSRGGAGVGRLVDGRVAFVRFTAKGDTVEVVIKKEHKNYVEAELVQVVTPSEDRIVPVCPVFMRCGGCSWQHIPYTVQFQTKLNGILHGLKRVQILETQIEPYPAADSYHYRNRIQLRGFESQMGMFEAKSRNLISIQNCAIARTEINAALEATRLEGSKKTLPYKVEVEVHPNGKVTRTFNSAHAALGFRQVNDAQNLRLQQAVGKMLTQNNTLFDLFGGNGNLCLPLTKRFKQIHCVDVTSPKNSVIGNLQFHRSPVLSWAIRFSKSSEHRGLNSAIIDPPRSGIGRDLVKLDQALKKMSVVEIVAIGCEVDSWARDIRHWVDQGWKLKSVAAVDLFPQTPHVEAIAQLIL